MKQKILVIVGPTSSGKSALAVELAKKFDGEIISADSRQIYRGLNIGTGKITRREMRGVRHHLLDVASPKRVFTAHDFILAGRRAIKDISGRGKLPIVCGGTGFYIDALVGRTILPNVPPNPKLRAALEKKTPAQLFALLKRRDPRRAKTIDPHNKRRLVRSLEIASSLGTSPRNVSRPLYNLLWLGIALPKDVLEKKIAERLSKRIRGGMIAEAVRLHKNGISYKRMEELGLEYRHLSQLLQRHISKEEFERTLFLEIRRFSKRQVTYWKKNKNILWITPQKEISSRVDIWLGGR